MEIVDARRRGQFVAFAFLLFLLSAPHDVLAEQGLALAALERSYWLHASLAPQPQKGYWGPSFPDAAVPTEQEVRNAARLLTGEYAANRLYLIYHGEIPIADAERVFTWWRRHTPAEVEIVPTLLLRMYDPQKTDVFSTDDLRRLAAFFKQAVNADLIGVYDVHPNRDQGPGIAILQQDFPHGMIRVGVQPDEQVKGPFVAAVEDTWSAFCHGKTNEDWRRPGFGAATLRQWVERRNPEARPVAWNLIVVAWDYSASPQGDYPGYDDAHKNMPLPAGRNLLAAHEILTRAAPDLGGFSSDLFILHVNSRAPQHDDAAGSFYETLKRGEPYRGYYASPFHEVVEIYQRLKSGKLP